jgi:hypothetical protein
VNVCEKTERERERRERAREREREGKRRFAVWHGMPGLSLTRRKAGESNIL